MRCKANTFLASGAIAAMWAACGDQQPRFIDSGPDRDAASTDGATSTDGGNVDGMTSEPDATTSDASTPGDAVTPVDAITAVDATPQSAMWRGAQSIEDLTGGAEDPAVGIDDAGHAIVVWRNQVPDPEIETRSYGELHARRYDPASGWGSVTLVTPPAIPTSHAFRFDLAVGPTGDAMVIWNQFDRSEGTDVMVRRFTPAGGWEPAVVLHDSVGLEQGSGWSRVAVGGDGSAVALYSKRGGDLGLDSQLYARHFVPSSGWAPATPLHVVPSGDAQGDDIAMDGSGRAVAVWTVHSGGSNSWGARFSPTGGWSAPVRLDSETGMQTDAVRVAVDPAGNAVVTLRSSGGAPSVWAVLGGADGTWQSPMRLDDAARSATEIDVAVDASGSAIAVWQSASADQPAAPDVRARRFTPGSGWSAIEPVESLAGSNESPRIAMTATGIATVAWMQSGSGIMAARLVPGSGWGTPERISSTEGGSYGVPAVAAGGTDRAVAAWTHNPVAGNPPAPYDLWANVWGEPARGR